MKFSRRARFIIALAVSVNLALPRPAEAFVAPLAVPYIVTAAGTSQLTIAAAAALAAAGAAVLGIVFKDSGGNDVLDLKLNPKAPERVPAGWTPSGTPGAAPVPPGTAGSITTTYWYANGSGQSQTTYTTALASCQAFLGTTNCASVSGPYSGAGVGPCASGVSPRYCAVPANTSIYSNVVTSCPTGYTLSGGSCNLTSAPDVPFPSDGIGRKDCSSGTCGNNARDPDNTDPANVTGGPGQVKVKSGTSTTTVTVNGDGSVTIKTVTPNGDGTSTETVLKTAPPNPAASDGGTNATGTSQKQVTGEGEAAEETATLSCAGGPCATESTQAANRGLLQDMKDNGIKVNEQAATWATPKAAADTAISSAKSAMTAHEGKLTTIAGGGNSSGLGVSGLSNFSAPTSGDATGYGALLPSVATCEAMSLSWLGRSFNVDYCPIANATRGILEWGLYASAFLYALLAFYRPKEA
jgi:hypothetical protein